MGANMGEGYVVAGTVPISISSDPKSLPSDPNDIGYGL